MDKVLGHPDGSRGPVALPRATIAAGTIAEIFNPPVSVERPARQTQPLVLASPHSGRTYPASFLERSLLDLDTLRRSEDSFVDILFRDAIAAGMPMVNAEFPRAFLDPNREPFELDPEMFETALPAHANISSSRVAAGIGTVAKVVTTGARIYRDKLSYNEVADRIAILYRPYHTALQELIAATKRRFGYCILLDCHSMPSGVASVPVPNRRPADLRWPARREADIVLGDSHGTASDPALIEMATEFLEAAGLKTARNNPYAGGYTTQHYGDPGNDVHALQIEINRRLYIDETTFSPTGQFEEIACIMTAMATSLAACPIRRPV